MAIEITCREVTGFCGAGHKEGDHWKMREEGCGICIWAMASILPFAAVLDRGGDLFWQNEGTKWAKNGEPVEYVRCPDPINTVVFEVRKV
jgi:uncharacterized repeat protein (TIGR04076 family)